MVCKIKQKKDIEKIILQVEKFYPITAPRKNHLLTSLTSKVTPNDESTLRVEKNILGGHTQ